ncbi:MAG: sigma-70 family RNA polymerase sigma factor [Xanthobacteraceae bacterium]
MPDTSTDRSDFDRALAELRPKLHRYCARMTGSVIDGEDVVQDALVKAIEALPRTGSIENPEGWLFRIAHNAALDYLRRRTRQAAAHEDMDMIADPADPVRDHQIAAASLRTFMRLPAAQRGIVILTDVLGYSPQEVSDVMGSSIAAVKSALQRGRMRLRELAQEPDDRPPPALSEPERARLTTYVERFNARDFDTVRGMLADDVKLDLVNRLRLSGRTEVGAYFTNYGRVHNWRFVPGFVEGQPAILVSDPNDASERTKYFILLTWADDGLVGIRDFLFASYAMDGAEVRRWNDYLPR